MIRRQRLARTVLALWVIAGLVGGGMENSVIRHDDVVEYGYPPTPQICSWGYAPGAMITSGEDV
jgi:hypothetical protein